MYSWSSACCLRHASVLIYILWTICQSRCCPCFVLPNGHRCLFMRRMFPIWISKPSQKQNQTQDCIFQLDSPPNPLLVDPTWATPVPQPSSSPSLWDDVWSSKHCHHYYTPLDGSGECPPPSSSTPPPSSPSSSSPSSTHGWTSHNQLLLPHCERTQRSR